MLDELGVGYELEIDKRDKNIHLLLPTDNEKISGYANFLSEYVFTIAEEFIEINNWEN